MKHFYKKILLVFLLSCNIKNIPQNQYFEGEVHFKIEYESFNDNLAKELLVKELGSTLIGKVKEDKYLMYQNSSGDLGTTKIIYLLKENTGYVEYEKSDTIWQFNIDEEPGELLEVTKNTNDKKLILGDSCGSVTIRYIPKQSYVEQISCTYYFNPKYKLNPKFYQNHKDSYWNLFVNESKSISVRNEVMNYPHYKSIYQAQKIIVKNIKETEFNLPKNKIIKQRNKD